MSEVVFNRMGVDHVNFSMTTSGNSIATTTLNDLLLDPNLEYLLRVSELMAPISSLPLFGFTTDGSTSVNSELFRFKIRIPDESIVDFQAIHTLAQPNLHETGFLSDFRTEGRGGVKYFTPCSFLSDLGKSAHNFSKKQDLLYGADPDGDSLNAPINGIGSIGSNSEYVRIRLNADGCCEIIGTSLFWNNFCIVFSEYGKRLLGIDDDFVRKELKTQPPGATVVYEYIMSVTRLDTDQLIYDMFVDNPINGNTEIIDLSDVGYDPLNRTVSITSTKPIFQNLDHRYFVSVETDLLVNQTIKVVDGSQTIDRSICKVFFPTQCKVLLESEEGVLREDVDFQIETRLGQYGFIKKTKPIRQWNALQSSYDLRFFRFHLYVTYRYFNGTKFILSRMKYPISKDDSWSIGIEFVSKI